MNGVSVVHLEPADGDAINEESLLRGHVVPPKVCFQAPDLALDRFPNHRIVSSRQPDQYVLRLKGQIPGFFPGLWNGVELLPQPRQSRLITGLRAVIHVEESFVLLIYRKFKNHFQVRSGPSRAWSAGAR